MYDELSHKGLEILAFPCNQFFKQESGTHQEILEFVRKRYNANFTLFQKIEVNGENTHPIYRYLRSKSELFNKKTSRSKVIPWNFSKFLLNSKGEVVNFFDPGRKLDEVRKKVEDLL